MINSIHLHLSASTQLIAITAVWLACFACRNSVTPLLGQNVNTFGPLLWLVAISRSHLHNWSNYRQLWGYIECYPKTGLCQTQLKHRRNCGRGRDKRKTTFKCIILSGSLLQRFGIDIWLSNGEESYLLRTVWQIYLFVPNRVHKTVKM